MVCQCFKNIFVGEKVIPMNRGGIFDSYCSAGIGVDLVAPSGGLIPFVRVIKEKIEGHCRTVWIRSSLYF